MTFSLCNLLFLASAEDGGGLGCESAAWENGKAEHKLGEDNVKGRKCQGSLDTFKIAKVLHFYQEAGLSLIKVARMGGNGVRTHCAKGSGGILFHCCGWDVNRCWYEWWEGWEKVNNGGKSAQGSVLLVQFMNLVFLIWEICATKLVG